MRLQLLEEIKRVFRVLVETRNPGTCARLLGAVSVTAAIHVERYDEPLVTVYMELLVLAYHRNKGSVAYWRMVLKTWRTLGGRLVELEVFELIQSLQTSINRGSDDFVRTWNPTQGPYRPAEDAAIKVALDEAFNSESISLSDYTVMRLFRGLGMPQLPLQL